MAEYTNTAIQTVDVGRNVAFTETPVKGCPKCISRRDGSGIVTIRGDGRRCFTYYRVSFGGNIAVPEDGTAGPISLAISVSGEPLGSAEAIQTPAAVDAYANVYMSVLIPVAGCDSVDIAVTNTSDQAINVQNANLIVDKEE